MKNIEELLAPISQEFPCGKDLEHDADFVSLETDSLGKPERIMGAIVIPAEEPDWSDIQHRAEYLFSRTKDLRMAVLLLRANTRCNGIVGFILSLKLIKGLLNQYWNEIYPSLDIEEDNDPTMRLNVLASLEDPNTLIKDVQSMSFICTERHTKLTVRDILITLGKLTPTGNVTVLGLGEVEHILQSDENKELLNAITEAVQVLNDIRSILGKQVSAGQVPDFKSLYDILNLVQSTCSEMSGATDSTGTVAEKIQQPGNPSLHTSEINSREDVVRTLEKVCIFIERTEPTNPAPLLIRRAQYLMTKNFMEILDELGPDWLKQVQSLSAHNKK